MNVITEEKLTEMLQESTGRHICDSGFAYGYHWEHNKGRDFAAEPEGSVKFYQRGEEANIIPTVSVYHFLRNRVTYNPELDRRFYEYLDNEGMDADLSGAKCFVSDGGGEPVIVNTYNGECVLSQVLQYVYWEDDDGSHVLLQIHGGCDVRGGYTDPVAFDIEETDIFDNAEASIYCDDCGKHWYTDNANNWYPEDGNAYTNLEDYPATDTRPNYPEKRNPAQRALPIDLPEPPEPCAVLWIDEDGNGHCPYCGSLLHLVPQFC